MRHWTLRSKYESGKVCVRPSSTGTQAGRQNGPAVPLLNQSLDRCHLRLGVAQCTGSFRPLASRIRASFGSCHHFLTSVLGRPAHTIDRASRTVHLCHLRLATITITRLLSGKNIVVSKAREARANLPTHCLQHFKQATLETSNKTLTQRLAHQQLPPILY